MQRLIGAWKVILIMKVYTHDLCEPFSIVNVIDNHSQKNGGKWPNAPEGCNDSLDLEMPRYGRICP
jgi:hypothetical protein